MGVTFQCYHVYIMMGGAEPSQPFISNSRKPIVDAHYGGLVYLSPNTATAYQLVHAEPKQLPSLLSLIAKRKTLLHPHLLTLRSHFVKQQSTPSLACGNEAKVELYLQFPYLTRTLQDIIEEYSTKGEMFPEKELVGIFGAVAGALEYLTKEGTCHGDVKASTILFDHMGIPKLIDSYFVSGGKTAYQIVLEDPSSMSLLAPEQLSRIKHRQPEDLSTIHMSEMFALGLTLIQAMTYQAAMQCYNLSALDIVEGYHLRKRQQLKSSPYSGKLCALALKCIEIQPTARPTFHQFLALLGE